MDRLIELAHQLRAFAKEFPLPNLLPAKEVIDWVIHLDPEKPQSTKTLAYPPDWLLVERNRALLRKDIKEFWKLFNKTGLAEQWLEEKKKKPELGSPKQKVTKKASKSELEKPSGRKEPAEASAKQPMEQDSAHPTDIASADEASTPLERQISPLNPDGVLRASQYYNELDHLAVRTAELCSLERLISSGPFDSEEDCIQLMKGTLSALMNLKQEGFCLGYFTVFVEEAQRNVAVSRRVYAKEVETLINTGENRQSLCQRLSVPGSMSVLSTTLALGVTSFAVSHSDQPECPVLDGAVCEIHIAPGLSLSLQPLDCLSDFVGDRLWVVGRRQSEHALKVCINVEDFGLLWGPVWLHGAVCETVGGWLAPVKETSNCNHSEAEYHYVDRFPLDAKDKEPLTETSCLLIGTLDAGKSTTDSSAQNTADLDAAPEEDRAPQGSQSPCSKKPLGAAEDTGIATPNPGAFSVNKACQTSMDSIQQRMALSLHFPGVEKARYESEGYNVGISGGKFVNLSLTEKFKRHKGKTVKDSIFNQNL